MTSDTARTLARLHLDIANELYKRRERTGLTVEQIADRAELSPDRVLMIEEGDTTSLTEVAQLCLALGVELADVIPRNSARHPSQSKLARVS